MTKIRIKKDDIVIVNTGSEKGKKGKVLAVLPKDNKVLVEGVNIRTIHSKAKRQGQESGIIKREKPINVSKVSFYNEKLGKGVKLGTKIEKDGTKVRFCKKTNEIV